MTYYATITSQGQITIPAEVRRRLGLVDSSKVLIKLVRDKIFLQSAPDVFSVAGKLRKYADKKGPIDSVIKKEEQAVLKAVSRARV